MHVIRPVGVVALSLLAFGTVATSAQNRPVAVPIVGSPAAESPAQPPAVPSQPPQVPSQPPAVPGPFAQPGLRSSAPPAAAIRGARKLVLSLGEGTVALSAENVTVRDILTEWQRQSGCRFVNLEKLPATPITREFAAGYPQLKALDSLLSELGTANNGYGYIVAPSQVAAAGQSGWGAVYILATSRPTASASYVPSASPLAAPLLSPGSPDDEIPPVMPFPPAMPPGQPRGIPGAPAPQAIPGQAEAPTQAPPVQSPGFGPVAPTAGGGLNPPPPPPPPGGRGGNQTP